MSGYKLSQLVFVSKNEDKKREYCNLLGVAGLIRSDMQLNEPQHMDVDALVLEKILQVKKVYQKVPFFVEHTGLTIEAWNGLPGGLISQFMDTIGNKGICKMMSAYKGDERLAKARVVIGYYDDENGIRLYRGEVDGTIAEQPRGINNFGWDPIFVPEESKKTFAEMDLNEKNQYSMRRKAVDDFRKFLARNYIL